MHETHGITGEPILWHNYDTKCCKFVVETKRKRAKRLLNSLNFNVGMTGFEPATTRPPESKKVL
jgi:hypothetical protein